jgi:predicted RNA-binding Zn-ribbon protein involved in translation (DUF1610 family)
MARGMFTRLLRVDDDDPDMGCPACGDPDLQPTQDGYRCAECGWDSEED